MKRSTIVCRPHEDGETVKFYLVTPEGEFWLFNNKYKSGLLNFYGSGRDITSAIDKSLSRNSIVLKIMEKLPVYIRYAEKENSISVMKKSNKQKRRFIPEDDYDYDMLDAG